MAAYRLFGRPGWGSAIVEAQFAGLGVILDYEEVPQQELLVDRRMAS